MQSVVRDSTTWLTPGNITRRSRSDASKSHRPAVLTLVPIRDGEPSPVIPAAGDEDLAEAGTFDRLKIRAENEHTWVAEWVPVPHQPFNEVFHEQVICDEDDSAVGGSGFIADLKDLTIRRTETGAGLIEYLQNHLSNFEQPVAEEIQRLASEVIDGKKEDD